jgi:putative ABC transport system permease protein
LLFFDMSSLGDLHLDRDFQNVRGAGNRVTVQTFAVIAALIMMIACINFAYLTLAKSDRRATEVGIRKVLGASKRQLLLQYLGESFAVVGAALLLGLVLVELLLPYLVNVLAIPLQIDYESSGTYLNIVGLYLLVALLGGLYPALMLSRFRPAAVLRSRALAHANARVAFKNLLLVFQFGVAIALIVATGVIYLQVEFVSHRDPGFKEDNLVFIDDISGREPVNANKEVLKARIRALPNVSDASLSGYRPMATTTFARVSSAHGLEGRTGEAFVLANTFIDENFFPTYDIALVAGRNFSLDQDRRTTGGGASDAGNTAPGSALINEAAARFLGFAEPGDAIGKLIVDPGSSYSIIGVVEDNQFYSLKAVTRPEIYFFAPALSDVLTVSYQGSAETLLENLQEVWRDTIGDAELAVSFIEPVLANEFSQERREGQMFVVFSLFSIFIACLGLYGASAFSVERRTKEIGIRKVMGAEVRQIVALLLWQLSKPVLLANVLAWPLALWAMLVWLRQFPYQIDVVLLIPLCVIAGVIALSIAWITTGSTAAKAAGAKPILALRYE